MIYFTKSTQLNGRHSYHAFRLSYPPLDMHVRCDVSGFVCGVVDTVAILENYTSYVGGCLPTLRYPMLVPY